MTDIRAMQIGQIVDFCIAFNERNKAEKKKEPKRRKASQNDINAFFG